MASPKAALLLLAAALLLSCCYASRSAAVLATGGEMKEEKKAVILSDRAKCEWMENCTQDKCNAYCLGIHLGDLKPFCSFYDLHFECCCPIQSYDPPTVTKIPASSTSAKHV